MIKKSELVIVCEDVGVFVYLQGDRGVFMRVLVDERWLGGHGIGRVAKEVLKGIPDYFSLETSCDVTGIFASFIISKSILKTKADVFYTPGFVPPLWSNVPYIITIHDLIHVNYHEESSLIKRIYYNTIVKIGARRAYCVMTDSEFSKQEIMEWSGVCSEKVRVMTLGVDECFIPQGPKFEPGYKYMLYVGNHRPHKNVKILLTSIKKINERLGIRLVLSGQPTVSESECIRKLGISDLVSYQGFIEDDELPQYYRGAEVFVFPSFYEGFGLPPMEAMACGTPAIVANATSLPEIVGDAALVFNPNSSNDLIDAVIELLSNKEMYKTYVKRGMERAKIFNWDKTRDQVNAVLKEAGVEG